MKSKPRSCSSLSRGLAALALLLVAFAGSACMSPDLGAAEEAVISDQNHGGVDGFVFLPPVTPPPAAFGDFVPAAAPTVIAEQLDPTDGVTVVRTLITYTTAATGIARIRVHLQGDLPDDGDADPTGYFVARLRTADFGLAGGDLVRFRVTVDGRQLGWADVKVLDARRDKKLIDRSQYGFVAAGKMLRVKFRIDRQALTIATDTDGDGVPDSADVCPAAFDPAQTDSLHDGVGDACRCDAVACAPSHAGCEVAACDPTTGACGAERCIEDHPATLSGTVIGIQFGPLSDATVRVTGPTGSVVTQPDAGGNFSISIPYAESDLRISRPGFADYTQHLTFGPDQLGEGYEVLLQPVLAWYQVDVWQDVGIPAPGAVVRVSFDSGGVFGASTDALGRAYFALLPVTSGFDLHVTLPSGLEHDSHHSALAPGINTILVGMY